MKKLELKHISRSFGGKQVLKDFSAVFETGRLYCLLGENGAGKSTLAHILSGLLTPTEGCIMIDGREVSFPSPKKAGLQGIEMVHQRPLLVKQLKVWENIALGKEALWGPQFLGIVNKALCLKKTEKLLRDYTVGVELHPEQITENLRGDQLFYTALLAALYKTPSFLILDEPSASLDENQRDALYKSLQNLTMQGCCVLVITHSLREAVRYGDYVLVLKKGVLSLQSRRGQPTFTQESIRRALFSEEKLSLFKTYSEKPENRDITLASIKHKVSHCSISEDSASLHDSAGHEKTLLSVHNVCAKPVQGAALFNVSFSVDRASLTLILGQRESGMETLENIITGMKPDVQSGDYIFQGKKSVPFSKNPLTPQKLREFGCGIVPFNRTFWASYPDLTVAQVAGIYETPVKKKEVSEFLIEQSGIKIHPQEYAKNLSGGMLQRLILARELYYKPRLLILSEPFQGLDSFATFEMTERLVSIKNQGTGILVLSGEGIALSKHADYTYLLDSGHLCSVDKGELL